MVKAKGGGYPLSQQPTKQGRPKHKGGRVTLWGGTRPTDQAVKQLIYIRDRVRHHHPAGKTLLGRLLITTLSTLITAKLSSNARKVRRKI